MAQTAFQAAEIFGEQGIEREALLIVEDGRFAGFCSREEALRRGMEIREYGDAMILPGLVESHMHGAIGCDTMDATPEALRRIGRFLLEEGTTSWQPTTVTAPLDAIGRALANVKACMALDCGARIIGCFVEGPYITAEHKGAHPEELIRPLRTEELDAMLAAGPLSVLIVAPEKAGAAEFIRYAAGKGVRISLGHSGASYEAACAAFDAGADAAVHTFCGMSGLHHRAPHLLGAALTRDDVYAELIADGIHVQNPAMQILLRCKPKDRVILVSDAIQATGLPDGRYQLGVLPVIVKDGIPRVESGSLAGSTATLLQEVRRLTLELGVEPLDAAHMASLNPSRRLGLADRIGSIAAGKLADFIIVDKNYALRETWLGGNRVVKKEAEG